MALNKNQLKSDLRSILSANRTETDESAALTNLVNGLANAIESYVKSGTVKALVTGIITAGSPTTQTQTASVTATGVPTVGTGGIT